MYEENLRKQCCCFTGHRPEKLRLSEQKVADRLEAEIRKAITGGYTIFITGMAKGVDLIAAEIVLRLRAEDPRLKLICALPHPGFGQHWGGGWTARYRRVLEQADWANTLADEFSYAAYQVRNEWMVQHAGLIIAVFNGGRGGTKNTLEFAHKCGVPCVIIDG